MIMTKGSVPQLLKITFSCSGVLLEKLTAAALSQARHFPPKTESYCSHERPPTAAVVPSQINPIHTLIILPLRSRLPSGMLSLSNQKSHLRRSGHPSNIYDTVVSSLPQLRPFQIPNTGWPKYIHIFGTPVYSMNHPVLKHPRCVPHPRNERTGKNIILNISEFTIVKADEKTEVSEFSLHLNSRANAISSSRRRRFLEQKS